MSDSSSPSVTLTALQQAYHASLDLERLSGSERDRGVRAMADAINDSFDDILEANTIDLELSREMAVSDLLLDWLKLTPERLENVVGILRRVAQVSDPLERVINAPYQLNWSQTYCQLMPLGVIVLIHEAFPELGAIAAGLCLKTSNSLVVRGCNTSIQTSNVIARILQTALEEAGLPQGCLEFLSPESGESIHELVTQDRYVNLVIPYGRPSLLEQVSQEATAPILPAAIGNCYLYWSPNGDLERVRQIVLDSHATEPDPVNAIEKILISPTHNPSFIARLFNSLQENGFELRGDPSLCEEFPEYLTPVSSLEWRKPYLNKIIAFKTVSSLSEAIVWMNRYSSSHADCIVTESYQESRQFAMEIDSALVYINASPRFYRNPQQGESVFLGISNQKGYRRGLMSLETFTTVKQVVQGNSK